MYSGVCTYMSPKRETITRTIRIERRYDTILREEAERKGYSVNALMDQILKRYVDLSRFYDGQMILSFTNQTFFKFFDKLDDDDIDQIVESVSIEDLKESLMMRGLSVNVTSIVWFVKQFLGEFKGWFRCDVTTENQITRLYLRHNFEHKWSYFLKQYLTSIFNETLGIEPSFAVMRNSVSVEFPMGKIQKQ